MKKTLTILLSMLMLLVFTATCMASTVNEKALAKKPDKVQVVKQKIVVKKELKQKYEEKVKERTQKTEKQTTATKVPRIKDVENHWAAHSVQLLYAAGLISGYTDGTFKPDNSITEAEIISLITKLADDETITDDDEDVTDEDLDNVPAWVKGSAKKAAQLGFLNLNRFHSNVQATRVQTAVWIAKAIKLEPVNVSDMPFKDGVLISSEDAGYIIALYQEKIIFGTPGGKFNPNSCITRAEIAAIMERILADGDFDSDEAIVSVTLPATATVEQGKSITLKATVKYEDGTTDNDVTWSSSDTDLATVEDGVVTAADDETGTVTIKATATKDGITKSASCEVKVVDEIETLPASLTATGAIGVHDGKVYQEFKLMADGDKIDIDEDNVSSITMTKDDGTPVTLTPNSDDTLWFNVQKATGFYQLNVEKEDGTLYEATLDWVAPEEVDADLTGDEEERDGDEYTEYEIGNLDLSDADAIYQIKSDGTADELTVESDSNLWINTDDQENDESTFLIYIDGDWYTTEINF
ncbi:MAG: S-layer homology domain-containing protein [Syntrophomonas sp.]